MDNSNKCGFDNNKECTEACKYYETCTRNPNKKGKAEVIGCNRQQS